MPFEQKQGIGLDDASAFSIAQAQQQSSASAQNGANGGGIGANTMPFAVQGALAQGHNIGFQLHNNTDSFMQRSPAEQAEAAYAAAAMAERRLAVSTRGNIDKKDSNENSLVNSGHGMSVNASSNNGTNNILHSNALNQANMLMGNGAPGSNLAMNPAFANMLFPGAQGYLNSANDVAPANNTMQHDVLAQSGYGYQMQNGAGTGASAAGMILPGSAGLADHATSGAFAVNSIAGQGQAPATILNTSSILPSVASIPQKKKKVKGKPKRPLSAYNLFFKYERQRILASLSEDAKQSEIEIKRKLVTDEDKTSDSENNENKTVLVTGEDASSSADTKDGAADDDAQKDVPSTQQEKDLAAKPKKKPHGKIGFETLAKTIGRRWAKLETEPLKKYKDLANEDMKRYKSEMEVFLTKRQEIEAQERSLQTAESAAPVNSNSIGGNEATALDQQFQLQFLQQQANQANPWGGVMNNGNNPATNYPAANYPANSSNSAATQNNMLIQALLMQQMNQQQQQQQMMINQQALQQMQHRPQSDGGQNLDYSEPSSKKQRRDPQDAFQNQSFANAAPLQSFGLQPGAGAMGNVANGLYGNLNPSMNGGNFLANMNNMMAMGNLMNGQQQQGQQQHQGQQQQQNLQQQQQNLQQQQQNLHQQQGHQQNGQNPSAASMYSSGGGVSPSIFNMGQ